MSIKLNLGCGANYLDGYINVDHPRTVTPKDLAMDLEKTPWYCFQANYADEILMQDVLEHLTFPDEKINEVHRILKPGGRFWGGVPYGFSDGAIQHLEHRCFWTEKSFEYLTGVSGYPPLGGPKFKLDYVRLTSCNNTWRTRCRNLIPFRTFLRHWLRNMYDSIEFSLIKL